MRPMRIPWWMVTGVLLFALAGCASRGSIREGRDETVRLQAQLARLRQVNESTTRELARVTLELKGLAEDVVRLAQARREVTGQVSRVEAGLAETEQAIL
ncbi:MAG: hypothetical protein ACE5FK_10615, partial [Candidatus Methylomirabilia bacterium]